MIQRLLDERRMQKLFLMENKDSLRPLELAFHFCTHGLCMAFIENSNVYMRRRDINTVQMTVDFKITEYELSPSPQSCRYDQVRYKMTQAHMRGKFVQDKAQSIC